jgi:hypothetical protein
MAAVARDLDNVLLISVAAMIAAILIVAADRTATAVVATFVIFVCHRSSPPVRNFVDKHSIFGFTPIKGSLATILQL